MGARATLYKWEGCKVIHRVFFFVCLFTTIVFIKGLGDYPSSLVGMNIMEGGY